MEYITRNENRVLIEENIILTNQQVIDAINFANNKLNSLYKYTMSDDINIFEILGIRNLSGMVGEYLVKGLQHYSNDNLQPNLHQDGFPDLLLTNTTEKKEYYRTLYTINNGKKYPRDKSLFSPYKFGGIEVKATCGSTPAANIHPKPLIGEQRIDILENFDWKAHHRETNNLIGILWDFIDEVPTIVAVFYRNDLNISDWGKIVQPQEGGGRTTSVSIMKNSGIKKMCAGWVAILNSEKYINALSDKKWIGYKIQ